MGLNPMHKRFVEEYVKDQNATEAYLRAGFKCKRESARNSAHRLMTNDDVKKAIEKKSRKLETRITRETDRTVLDVIRDIQTVKDRAMSEGSHKDALKALELEGKYLGMFSDKLKIEGDLSVNMGLASLLEEVMPPGTD